MGPIRRLFAALAVIGAASLGPMASGLGGVAHAQAPDQHLKASLVSAVTAVTPGQDVQLALRQEIEPGWHTYWRNPGDAGTKTTIAWDLPKGFTTSDFVWPAPKRMLAISLMNYGYTGEVLLPVKVHVPSGLAPGSTVQLKAVASFLVCKDVCVPQDSPVSLDLPVGPSSPDPQWAGPIKTALDASPKPAGLTAVFAQDSGVIRLSVSGDLVKDIKAPVYFYPFDQSAIDHAAPQPAICGDSLGMTFKPSSALKDKTLTQLAGVLAVGDRTYEITARPGAVTPPSGTACPAPPPPEGEGLGSASSAPPPAGGLWPALIGAFLGGLILNLMPCVFPILSMKAASLSRHAHEAAKARTDGLLFLVGVLASFLALGGALLAARAAGAQLGWGFQLQSPPVVAGLCLIMLLVALNMSGLFEIGLSAQGVGADLTRKEGPLGALFTGVLAVVVAAPCTAPFMATALGFALTAPAILAMAVFLSLGLGFALPFVAAAFVPGLLARLPRPGPWMDIFKKAMAFPMYAAAAWLLWVLSQQTQAPDLARFLAAAVLVAFAGWMIGLGQQRGGKISGLVGLACLVLAFAGAVGLAYPPPAQAGVASSGALTSEPWSQARVDELASQGRPVFVDFTAAWCVTCQVNERAALASAKVAKAFQDTGTVYLRADWTNQDPAITAALSKQGRAGVPLYLVYGKAGGAPQVLHQLLSEGEVLKALKKAAT
ncbi:MAG: thiol:disulfide interchange protein [Caulobacteraceae bacterium]|nr:thiol:disulfide interchange protein [Caulobacteraceae bacterium]